MKLSLIDKAFLLKQCPLFSHLSLDMLMTIAHQTGLLSLESQELIFEEGQPAHSLYFIAQGSVLCSKGGTKTQRSVADFFGEEALFNEKNRAYSAHAKEGCVLLTISRSDFLSFIQESPAISFALLRIYTSHVGFRP